MSPARSKKGNGIWYLLIGLLVVLAIGGLNGTTRPATSAPPPSGAAGGTGTQVAGNDVVRRLEQMGLRARVRDSAVDRDCAGNSYGQAQAWFRTHPCTDVTRHLIDVSDARGNTALVAVAGVRMPDTGSAAELKSLVDRGGTGNVKELAGTWRDGMPYGSRRSGAVFVNAQAQSTGARAPADLDAIAKAASG